MASEQSTPKRWTRILLVLSLALNLVVIGVVAGSVFGGGSKGQNQRFDLTVGPLTRAMDDDRRDAVRDALRNSGVFGRDNHNALRTDMQALVETLRAQDFDSAAFQEVLGRQRARLQAGQDTVVRAVTAQIELMSAEERAAFADRIEDQTRRGAPRRQ